MYVQFHGSAGADAVEVGLGFVAGGASVSFVRGGRTEEGWVLGSVR